MAQSGAHLVDNVLPKAPYRQWVLSFPWPLRMLFAARPQWLSRVLGVVIRALSGALLKGAGVRHCDGGRTGMVTFIQRFGSKLNLNVHLHVLALEGAYTFEHGKAHFHRPRRHAQASSRPCLSTLITRITRTLVRAGVPVCRCAGGPSRAALPCSGDGLTLRTTGWLSNTVCHRRWPSGRARHDAVASAVAGGAAQRH